MSSVKCGWCGRRGSVPVWTNPPASHGDVTDFMPLCPAHRTQMKRLMGTSPSPGRPPKQPPKPKHGVVRHHWSRSMAPSPEPPRMPSSRPPVPEAPRMPRPGT